MPLCIWYSIIRCFSVCIYRNSRIKYKSILFLESRISICLLRPLTERHTIGRVARTIMPSSFPLIPAETVLSRETIWFRWQPARVVNGKGFIGGWPSPGSTGKVHAIDPESEMSSFYKEKYAKWCHKYGDTGQYI